MNDDAFPSWLTERAGAGGLLAVLCNPPLKEPSDTVSWKNVAVLATILGHATVKVENLIEVPTKSTHFLAGLADDVDTASVQRRLSAAAATAEAVIVAWGTANPPGWSRGDWAQLTGAAYRGLLLGGHSVIGQIGGAPRHPSRWRQHTSPIHERYHGGTFEERLRHALSWVEVPRIHCDYPERSRPT